MILILIFGIIFFGEPGSLNDLNILEKLTIVGSILNGMMELHLPQELHYPMNGTVHNYLYFLVDGIYPMLEALKSLF